MMRRWLALLVLSLSMLASAVFAATLKVPDEYPTIQAAVDAAAVDDIVSVDPGVWEEQVYITKNITLTGAGAGQTVIRSPHTLPLYWGPGFRPIVFVHNTDSVTISDLTVDGYGRGGTGTNRFLGIGWRDAGGRIERCEILNMKETPTTSTYTGAGVYASKQFPTPRHISMLDVVIRDSQKSGVILYGTGLTFDLTSVTVEGIADGSPATPNGIECGLGATGTIAGCQVSDSYGDVPTGYTATGILLYFATGVQIQSCTATENQTAVYFSDSSGTLDGCDVAASGTGRVFFGFYCQNGLPPKSRSVVPHVLPAPFAGEEPPGGMNGGLGRGDVYFDPAVLAGAQKDAVALTNCSFVGAGLSESAGIVVDSFYTTTLNVTGCDLTNWDYGFFLGERGGATIGGAMHGSQIHGNKSAGGGSTTVIDYDATGNWWGHPSGPHHPVLNPQGQGDGVSDHILFDFWTGTPELAVLPAYSGRINCETPATLTFRYTPSAVTPALRGYEIKVDATTELSFAESDITDLGPFTGLGYFYFDTTDNGDGTITVTSAILGPTAGLTTPADLFTIAFHGVASGAGGVSVPHYKLRDLDNGDILADVLGADVAVDCDPPGPVADITAEPGWRKVKVSWTASADDNAGDDDVIFYEVWRALWNDGNVGVSAYPEYDDVAPYNPSARPANRAAAAASGGVWELAATLPVGGTMPYVDDLPLARGVYTYEIFSMDMAGNYSAAAPDGNDRATNYWLGDLIDTAPVPPHYSVIDIADVSVLAAAFGTGDGDVGYNSTCDIGPTGDWSRTGIPTTDSEIEFEDLMILAMNFAVTTQTNKLLIDDGSPGTARPPCADAVPLAWRQLSDFVWTLELTSPYPALRGLRVRSALPAGVSASLQPGELLAQQSAPVFLRDIPRHGLDASLAVLGWGAGFTGAGELLRVTFAGDVTPAALAVAVDSPTITARGVANEDVVAVLAAGAIPRPVAHRLFPNHPNPFNPSATIRFATPAAERVRLAVYGLDGRRLATLVDADMPAGEHEAIWDGRDARGRPVASGMYVCRLEAGPFCQSIKMLLAR